MFQGAGTIPSAMPRVPVPNDRQLAARRRPRQRSQTRQPCARRGFGCDALASSNAAATACPSRVTRRRAAGAQRTFAVSTTAVAARRIAQHRAHAERITPAACTLTITGGASRRVSLSALALAHHGRGARHVRGNGTLRARTHAGRSGSTAIAQQQRHTVSKRWFCLFLGCFFVPPPTPFFSTLPGSVTVAERRRDDCIRSSQRRANPR